MAEEVTRVEELNSFCEGLPRFQVGPLWQVLAKQLTPVPETAVQPYLWRWEVIRPELMRSGELVSAAEAERRGLVSRIVDDAELEAEVREAAKRIGEGAPLAARATKRFINRLATGQPLTSEEVAESYALCDSEDYAEGVRAFTAKEKPKFRGR